MGAEGDSAPSLPHTPARRPGGGGTRLHTAFGQPGPALSWMKALIAITLWVRGKDQPATEQACPRQIPVSSSAVPQNTGRGRCGVSQELKGKARSWNWRAKSHPETHPFGRRSVGTMAGTYRQALANQETPYPHAAPGLGCCFPSYGPKGLLARPAAGRRLCKSSGAHNGKWSRQ